MTTITLVIDVFAKMLAPFAIIGTIGGATWAALLALQGKSLPTMHRTPTYVCYVPPTSAVRVLPAKPADYWWRGELITHYINHAGEWHGVTTGITLGNPYDWSNDDHDLR